MDWLTFTILVFHKRKKEKDNFVSHFSILPQSDFERWKTSSQTNSILTLMPMKTWSMNINDLVNLFSFVQSKQLLKICLHLIFLPLILLFTQHLSNLPQDICWYELNISKRVHTITLKHFKWLIPFTQQIMYHARPTVYWLTQHTRTYSRYKLCIFLPNLQRSHLTIFKIQVSLICL